MHVPAVAVRYTMNSTCVEFGGSPWEAGLGAGLALFGSTVLAAGMVGQRYAHLRIEARSPGTPYVTDPLWIAAFLIFLLGNFGDFAALTFAPQSVVTPLGAASLVITPLLARCLLDEMFTFATLVGSLVVILGVLSIVAPSLVIASCSAENVDTLVSRWRQHEFLVWAPLQLSGTLAVMAAIAVFERRMRLTSGTHDLPPPSALPAGAPASDRQGAKVIGGTPAPSAPLASAPAASALAASAAPGTEMNMEGLTITVIGGAPATSAPGTEVEGLKVYGAPSQRSPLALSGSSSGAALAAGKKLSRELSRSSSESSSEAQQGRPTAGGGQQSRPPTETVGVQLSRLPPRERKLLVRVAGL